jgi:D-alanine-D-alanine ligase-like ATP-grasp enzyme
VHPVRAQRNRVSRTRRRHRRERASARPLVTTMSDLRIALLADAEPSPGQTLTLVALEDACRVLKYTSLRVAARSSTPDATMAELAALDVDVVIPVLRSDARRTLAVRWLLDWAQIAYVGSDALAMSIACDPTAARGVLASCGCRLTDVNDPEVLRFEVALLGWKTVLNAASPRLRHSHGNHECNQVTENCVLRFLRSAESPSLRSFEIDQELRHVARKAHQALGLAGYSCVEVALERISQ